MNDASRSKTWRDLKYEYGPIAIVSHENDLMHSKFNAT